MSDTDSDSKVQFNIRPNRNNVIQEESSDEASKYESQNEPDFEQPSSNVDVDVSSPLDTSRINTTQSEPSDTVVCIPRSQGSAARVDIPGRRSPAFNVGNPDQHSNATHPLVDIPGRRQRSPAFNVGLLVSLINIPMPLINESTFLVDVRQHSVLITQINIPMLLIHESTFLVDVNVRQHSMLVSLINIPMPLINKSKFLVDVNVRRYSILITQINIPMPLINKSTFLVDVGNHRDTKLRFRSNSAAIMRFPCVIMTDTRINLVIVNLTRQDVLVHQIFMSLPIVKNLEQV